MSIGMRYGFSNSKSAGLRKPRKIKSAPIFFA
jgi:hypothetical protein